MNFLILTIHIGSTKIIVIKVRERGVLMVNLIRTETFETRKRHQDRKLRIKQNTEVIPKGYNGDIRRYLEFCKLTNQSDSVESLLDYLDVSLKEQCVKKNTWERRLAAIRKHLTVTQGINFKKETEVTQEISAMRKEFTAEQKKVEGKSAIDKQELLDVIVNLPTRKKAITYVNLITANRPSEMVRMKIKDFDLDGRFVEVKLVKQDKIHTKRLSFECVKAVREYISEFKLQPDDYFVGRYNYRKSGKYESVQISEIGYAKALLKWTQFTAYNFRKTQVVAMHTAGADLSTIAKQTGHKSLAVLGNHYLDVANSTIDKYL